MMKLIKILSVYCLILLFIGGCATNGGDKRGKEGATEEQFSKVISLSPSSFDEECLKLSPTQTLNYTLTATGNVYFNIHNHGKKGRTYVIQKEDIKVWKGAVDPSKLGDSYDRNRPQFCMLSKNKSDRDVQVALEYTITSR